MCVPDVHIEIYRHIIYNFRRDFSSFSPCSSAQLKYYYFDLTLLSRELLYILTFEYVFEMNLCLVVEKQSGPLSHSKQSKSYILCVFHFLERDGCRFSYR